MYKQLIDKAFHSMIEGNKEIESYLETSFVNYQKHLHKELLTKEVTSFINKVNKKMKERNPYLNFRVLSLNGRLIYMNRQSIYELKYDYYKSNSDDIIQSYQQFLQDKDMIEKKVEEFYQRVQESSDKILLFIEKDLAPFVQENSNALLRKVQPLPLAYSINDNGTKEVGFTVSIKGTSPSGTEIIQELVRIKEKEVYKLSHKSYVDSLLNKAVGKLKAFTLDLSREYNNKVVDRLKELNILSYTQCKVLEGPYVFNNRNVTVSFQFLDLTKEEQEEFQGYYYNWLDTMNNLSAMNPRLKDYFHEFLTLDKHTHPSRINLRYPEDTLKVIREIQESTKKLHRHNIIPENDYLSLGYSAVYIEKKYEDNNFLVYEYTYNVSKIYHKVFYKGQVATSEQKKQFWEKYISEHRV